MEPSIRSACSVLLGAAMAVIPSTAPDHAHADPAAISYAGTCVFGTSSPTPPLILNAAPTGTSILGYGSCTTTVGATTGLVELGGLGNFGCQRTADRVVGSVYFNPQPPDSQGSTLGTAVMGRNSLDLVLTSYAGDFYAVGHLWWSGNPTGCVTTALQGVMTFADS